ncbi:hypothetical protein SEA_RASPUTIA_47 [Microbacterium phage Rasputia]|nr:hypothetical protein SEA_RASPUTIA_47 [Microbacterium phage Rasputia]
MKELFWYLAGIGTAWAALAIWQHRGPWVDPDNNPLKSTVPYDAKRHEGMYP